MTASEFVRKKFPENTDGMYVRRNMEETMVDFAKHHVELALKEASEKATMQTRNNRLCDFDKVPYNIIHKRSILNAYPLTNIK